MANISTAAAGLTTDTTPRHVWCPKCNTSYTVVWYTALGNAVDGRYAATCNCGEEFSISVETETCYSVNDDEDN